MTTRERAQYNYENTNASRMGPLTALARREVIKALSTISSGVLSLQDGDGRREWAGTGTGSDLSAHVRIHDPAFYLRVVLGGTIGAGEAYMDGLWDCDDLTGLVRIMVRNQGSQDRLEGGLARIAASLQRFLHRLNDNTRRGSRRNIAAHYDLGNDFYRLFLDPTMTYSCGIFEHPRATMEDASLAKLDGICRRLHLKDDMRVLEIGGGWGGFAIHAARSYGCHVTTTTLSSQQYAFALERIQEAGLEDKITLLQKDYRDLEGKFDRLVSIEMIEAVGHRHLPAFFRVCGERLKADGAALIQAITMPDANYERYLNRPDFINRYIFPGGCCPSRASISHAVQTMTDLSLVHAEDLTPHYVRTLQEWRAAFHSSLEAVRSLGYDERFIRMWRYYLSYCEGGFAEEVTRVLQLLYLRPHYRGALRLGGAA
jgi:cyclopropane-fatty-acyl-phospholipid synthase